MIGNRQFSLASIFIATVFVAVACPVAKFAATMPDAGAVVLATVLLCGAVGALRRRIRPWLGYDVIAGYGLMMLVLTVGQWFARR